MYITKPANQSIQEWLVYGSEIQFNTLLHVFLTQTMIENVNAKMLLCFIPQLPKYWITNYVLNNVCVLYTLDAVENVSMIRLFCITLCQLLLTSIFSTLI